MDPSWIMIDWHKNHKLIDYDWLALIGSKYASIFGTQVLPVKIHYGDLWFHHVVSTDGPRILHQVSRNGYLSWDSSYMA